MSEASGLGDDAGAALFKLLFELVEEELADRFRRAGIAGEERAFDHFGQVFEGEDGSVGVGKVFFQQVCFGLAELFLIEHLVQTSPVLQFQTTRLG